MKYISELGIMVAIISFLGFIVENVWLAITKGYINNCNMNTPFLLGYGLMLLLIFLHLGHRQIWVFDWKKRRVKGVQA